MRRKGPAQFEFVRSLIEAGQASGELDGGFSVDDLAMGIYGQLNSYVMVRLLVPDCPLDRRTAKQIVRLFLQGAARRQDKANGAATRHSLNPSLLFSLMIRKIFTRCFHCRFWSSAASPG